MQKITILKPALRLRRTKAEHAAPLRTDVSYKKDRLVGGLLDLLSHPRHRDQTAADIDVHDLQPGDLLIDLFGDQFIKP